MLKSHCEKEIISRQEANKLFGFGKRTLDYYVQNKWIRGPRRFMGHKEVFFIKNELMKDIKRITEQYKNRNRLKDLEPIVKKVNGRFTGEI